MRSGAATVPGPCKQRQSHRHGADPERVAQHPLRRSTRRARAPATVAAATMVSVPIAPTIIEKPAVRPRTEMMNTDIDGAKPMPRAFIALTRRNASKLWRVRRSVRLPAPPAERGPARDDGSRRQHTTRRRPGRRREERQGVGESADLVRQRVERGGHGQQQQRADRERNGQQARDDQAPILLGQDGRVPGQQVRRWRSS